MTEQQANAVYDILVAEAGAIEYYRDGFIFHIGRGCLEYRCCWVLGVGGKFRPKTMTVDYYPEDKTPERDKIVATVNRKLRELSDGEVPQEAGGG